MSNSIWLMLSLCLFSADAPSIISVDQDPIPLGALVTVTGTDFVQGATTVTLNNVEQTVVFTQPNKVIFTVSLGTRNVARKHA